MKTATVEPQAWVGCLACYNAGRLVGAWMDGTEADDRDKFEELIDDASLRVRFPDTHTLAHEELWVMDHQGYGGFLSGECSPSEAAKLAEAVERIDGEWYPIEAVAAYRDHVGEHYFDLDDLSEFEEAYAGEYDSEVAYAEELAEELGAVPEDASWPNSYIDWEGAARDLFIGDFFSVDAPEHGIYVFRRL